MRLDLLDDLQFARALRLGLARFALPGDAWRTALALAAWDGAGVYYRVVRVGGQAAVLRCLPAQSPVLFTEA